MGSIVYLDGKFVAPEEAKVSIFDFGYLFGDGFFETLRTYGGRFFRLGHHLDRFFAAARYTLITPPVGREELDKLCHEALERSGNPDAYVRVTLSRGVGRGIDPASCGEPTLSIVAREHVPYPEECYRDGIETKVVSVRRVADDALSPRIKGNNYQNHILAKIELNQCGLREGFLLNQRGFVAEGTISNVFVLRQGTLATPSLASGCLEGITRNAVLEIAGELGIPVREAELTPYDLHTADECFVTNTLMELMPVVRVDGRTIGEGGPGASTLDLHRHYRALVEREGEGVVKSAHLLTRIDSELKPIDYFRKIAHEEHSFFLDSGMDPEKLGRYSFVGHEPFLVFKNKGRRIEITHGGETTVLEGDPFLVLRETLASYRIDPATLKEPVLPLVGGAVGYLGYELNQHLEKLPNRGADDLALPDCYFLFVDALIVYDHRESQLYLSAVGFGETQEKADASARSAEQKLRSFMKGVEAEGPREPDLPPIEPLEGNPLEAEGLDVREISGKQEYMGIVDEAKEHIFAGDIFEVCTTHRLNCDFDGDPWDLYEELRRGNPAPFASFFNLPEVKIVSASPERFMRVGREGRAESRPIKGTRPRGRTPEEDKANHDDLFGSVKDRAENMMIVDLVRNDFGRVCRFSTVEVSELMIIEKYSTVFQMVSTIVGDLDEGRDAIDLIRAAWPGGSMTGAPKIEAMGIIDALEPVKRGIYSGSIGYFDFAGHVDFNIVIRTILLVDGVAYFQVGGAIVADSDPEDEYLETLDKARALIRALRAAQLRSSEAAPRARAEHA